MPPSPLLRPRSRWIFALALLVAACKRNETPAPPPEVAVVKSALTVDAHGLLGEYFDNDDLTAPVMARVDPTVDANWGTGAPAPGVGVDTFSVRWTGFVTPQFSETYSFIFRSDDGVRLWIDGSKIIDDWTDHSARDSQGSIALQGGQAYSIRLEYYDNTGNASAQLSWSSAHQSRQVIPTDRLSPGADGCSSASGLVGNWPLDESSGTVARDTTCNQSLGTLRAPGSSPWQPGKIGGAASFANQMWITVPDSSSLDSVATANKVSVTAWVNAAALPPGWISLVSRQSGQTGSEHFGLTFRDGKLTFAINTFQSGTKFCSAPTVAPTGQWLHVAGTFDGSTARAYLDGREVCSFARAVTLGTDSTPLTIGGAYNSADPTATELFSGLIDQVALYNRVLSPAELEDLAGGAMGNACGSPETKTGLLAEIYDNKDWTNPKVSRVDPTVDVDWDLGSPDPIIGADTYSVVWSGFVTPRFGETYTFITRSDDGVRLSVDGTVIIDKLIDHSLTEYSGTITLAANKAYAIRLQYYDNSGHASAQLLWQSSHQAREVIPTSQLTPFGEGCSAPGAVIGRWMMDSGAGITAVDSTCNANQGTLRSFGSPTWVTGISGKALSFDGSSNWVRVPDSPSLDAVAASNQVSASAWVNLSQIKSGWTMVVMRQYQDTGGEHWGLAFRDGKFRWLVNTQESGTASCSDANVAPTGTWIHVAGTYDGAVARAYVNGVEVCNFTRSVRMQKDTTPMIIGAGANQPGDLAQEFFAGAIDEVAVWSRALSGSEVMALAGSTGACDIGCPDLPLQACEAPSSASADVMAGGVLLNWQDNSGREDGFQILRSTDNVTFTSVGAVGANEMTFLDATAQPNVTYFYKLGARSSLLGDSPFIGVGLGGRPIANPGPNQVVAERELVTLDGSGSFIPNGIPLYTWTQIGGTTIPLDAGLKPSQRRFVAPTVTAVTDFTFKLEVSDSFNSSLARTVTISVFPSGIRELTPQGTIVANILAPTGSGNHDPETIRNGDRPPVGNSEPLRQYDTFTGDANRTTDWIGYQYPSDRTFHRVVFQEGMHFHDGGWFETLGVQVRSSATAPWVDVPITKTNPAYPGIDNMRSYETYELSFNPVVGQGIRIVGRPGGSARFISVGELRVYGSQQPSRSFTPTQLTGPTTPDLSQAETAISSTSFGLPRHTVTVITYNDSDPPPLVEYPTVDKRIVRTGASNAGWSVFDSADPSGWKKKKLAATDPNWPVYWGDPSLAAVPNKSQVFMTNVAVNIGKWPSQGFSENLFENISGACIFRSLDGGVNFGVYQCVTNQLHFYDGSALAATPSGEIFAAYNDTDMSAHQIDVWHAPTVNGTFVPLPPPFPGQAIGAHPRLVATANGVLVAATGPGAQLLMRSFQGGSWGTLFTVATGAQGNIVETLGGGITVRQNSGISFAVGPTEDDPSVEELRLWYTTQLPNGKFVLKGIRCSLSLNDCEHPAAWETDPSTNTLIPAVAVATPLGTEPIWKLTFHSAYAVPDGQLALWQANFARRNGVATVRFGKITDPQTPCAPSIGMQPSNYWGDFDYLGIEASSALAGAPAFVRPFTDSTAGACQQLNAREALPQHVSFVTLSADL